MSKSQKYAEKKRKRRLEKLKKQQARRQRANATHLQDCQKQQKRRKLVAKAAQEDPIPAPTGAAHFLSELWDSFKLDLALLSAGIMKDGLPVSTIFLIVAMMGIMGAPSLNQLAAQVSQDLTLMTIFTLHELDENQLYRTLQGVGIPQYKAFCIEWLRSLQTNPVTAARKNGVVSGDTTQIIKNYAKKIPGVSIIFSHSEKRFVNGMEVITTHYSDSDKDYPLTMDFYQPNEETKAERQAQKERREANVNGRKPQEVAEYLAQQVKAGNKPELVVISGNRLSKKFRQAIDKLGLSWLGISGKKRVYQLEGQQEKANAKTILAKVEEDQWIEDESTGYRLAILGLASSAIGSVLLIATEHVVDQVRTLYLMPAKCQFDEALSVLSAHLAREEVRANSGILHQMLELLRQVRQDVGLVAENTAFDSWFCVPWFICDVLSLGFARVVTQARHNFNYTYQGKIYKLSQLWDLLKPTDFSGHTYKGIKYQLATLVVEVTGLGEVKLTFVRQSSRRSRRMLQAVLLCTDCEANASDILRIYKLRWRIEVCYREVKQNHCFGKFRARHQNTIYGQTLLSLMAYTFVETFRLLVPRLKDESLGQIVEIYLNVVVNLVFNEAHQVEIEFPKWLILLGLPDWGRLTANNI